MAPVQAVVESKRLIEDRRNPCMFDSEKIKIRYYSGDPMALRPLWDTIFADPKCFADYYFENVCAMKCKNGVKPV